MKRVFPLAFIALLLCGCPDSKLPTPTPKVPEPKADTPTSFSSPVAEPGIPAARLPALSRRA